MLAEGTKDSLITFTINNKTGFSDMDTTLGGWNRIVFHNGARAGGANGAMNDNDSSKLIYCRIQYCKNLWTGEDEWNLAGGAVTVIGFSRLVISNCEISNNRSRQHGGGITCKLGADFIVKDNLIENNITQDRGGGVFCISSSPLIIKNEIINNKSLGSGGGGGIYCELSEAIIKNNVISYNEAFMNGGLFLFQSSTTVDSNIISYNMVYN